MMPVSGEYAEALRTKYRVLFEKDTIRYMMLEDGHLEEESVLSQDLIPGIRTGAILKLLAESAEVPRGPCRSLQVALSRLERGIEATDH